ncbi:MAG: pentapeptide repeat-containing protein [Alphaproteobacteria bacterium]
MVEEHNSSSQSSTGSEGGTRRSSALGKVVYNTYVPNQEAAQKNEERLAAAAAATRIRIDNSIPAWQQQGYAHPQTYIERARHKTTGLNIAGFTFESLQYNIALDHPSNGGGRFFSQVNAQGAIFNGQSDFLGADFSSWDLRGATLALAILDYANFSPATAEEGITYSLAGANFSGASLENSNFYKADLANATFANGTATYLNTAHFNNANMQGVNAINCDFEGNQALQDVNLQEAQLIHANFNEANLNRSILAGANFEQAKLNNTKINGVDVSGVNFKDAQLRNVNLSFHNDVIFGEGNQRPILTGANLQGANLSGRDLSYMDLSGVDLSGADLNGANLTGANLSGAIFSSATQVAGIKLTNADLSGAILNDVDLSWGDLASVTISESTQMARTNLAFCNLAGAIIEKGANLKSANMNFADCTGASIIGVDLSSVNMVDINFNAADLADSNLSDKDFTRCNIEGANFAGAIMHNVNLNDKSFTGPVEGQKGVSFEGADLTGAILNDVDLSWGDLASVTISESTQMARTNLAFCNLAGAIIEKGANLKSANMNFADCTGASIIGVDLSSVNMVDINFNAADLADSNLSDKDFTRCNIEGANFAGAIMHNVNLNDKSFTGPVEGQKGVSFEGADLTGATLNNCTLSSFNLNGANLTGASLEGSILSNISCIGANFTHASLNNSNILLSNMNGAILNDSRLDHATLHGSVLIGAKLNGAYMEQTAITDCNLEKTELKQAKISSAALNNINLQQADLSGTILKNCTYRNIDLCDANMQRTFIVNDLPELMHNVKLDRADLSHSTITNLMIKATTDSSHNRLGEISDANFTGVKANRLHITDTHLVNVNFSGMELTDLGLSINGNSDTSTQPNMRQTLSTQKNSYDLRTQPQNVKKFAATIQHCNFSDITSESAAPIIINNAYILNGDHSINSGMDGCQNIRIGLNNCTTLGLTIRDGENIRIQLSSCDIRNRSNGPDNGYTDISGSSISGYVSNTEIYGLIANDTTAAKGITFVDKSVVRAIQNQKDTIFADLPIGHQSFAEKPVTIGGELAYTDMENIIYNPIADIASQAFAHIYLAEEHLKEKLASMIIKDQYGKPDPDSPTLSLKEQKNLVMQTIERSVEQKRALLGANASEDQLKKEKEWAQDMIFKRLERKYPEQCMNAAPDAAATNAPVVANAKTSANRPSL